MVLSYSSKRIRGCLRSGRSSTIAGGTSNKQAPIVQVTGGSSRRVAGKGRGGAFQLIQPTEQVRLVKGRRRRKGGVLRCGGRLTGCSRL
jgi:hypothetical protein